MASITRRNTEESARFLTEDLARTLEENQSLREGLKSSEGEARELLRKENEKYNHFYKTSTAQLEKLRAEKAGLEEFVTKAQAKLQAKENELQKCKDALFDLQPPSQISDVQLGSEWDRLCGNIAQWIDDQIVGMTSLHAGLKKLRIEDRLTDTVRRYWGEDRYDLAQYADRYPSLMDLLIRYNIHCLLERTIFSESVYMVGLRQSTAELLAAIEQQMKVVEPRKGRVVFLGV